MQKVNFFLWICFFSLGGLVFSSPEGGASSGQYIPARKIAKKRSSLPPGVVRRSDFKRPDTPLSQSSGQSSYGSQRQASSYFKKQLAGPYISGSLGVQMHRHQVRANDAVPQVHKIHFNSQRLAMEVSLGWVVGLANYFFMGAEAGLNPIPASSFVSISDGTTTASIRGEMSYFGALLLGRHFNEGSALAYLRFGAEWRKFKVKHEVQDATNDDIDTNKTVFGFSPGIGVGFLLFDSIYTIAEYRTTLYNKFTLISPNGGRLTFRDQNPRVDTFLLKFILPLNPYFGTRYGACDE